MRGSRLLAKLLARFGGHTVGKNVALWERRGVLLPLIPPLGEGAAYNIAIGEWDVRLSASGKEGA